MRVIGGEGKLSERIGPYRLVQQIGEGGMGVVHLGLDPENRTVAVKVLRPQVAGDATARRRLAREVETMRRVHNPHVAEIVDADVTGDAPYVVTQYVPGHPLDSAVDERGPVRGAALRKLTTGLASALAAIHGAGIIHRDLKPANVMLVDGSPIVIDFGIAQAVDTTRLTQTGMFIGTPGYLAPEVIQGADVGPASDIHALASTLIFAATGHPPFGSGGFELIFFKILQGQPDLAGVPMPLVPILTQALSRDPQDRPPAAELARRFAELDLRDDAPLYGDDGGTAHSGPADADPTPGAGAFRGGLAGGAAGLAAGAALGGLAGGAAAAGAAGAAGAGAAGAAAGGAGAGLAGAAAEAPLGGPGTAQPGAPGAGDFGAAQPGGPGAGNLGAAQPGGSGAGDVGAAQSGGPGPGASAGPGVGAASGGPGMAVAPGAPGATGAPGAPGGAGAPGGSGVPGGPGAVGGPGAGAPGGPGLGAAAPGSPSIGGGPVGGRGSMAGDRTARVARAPGFDDAATSVTPGPPPSDPGPEADLPTSPNGRALGAESDPGTRPYTRQAGYDDYRDVLRPVEYARPQPPPGPPQMPVASVPPGGYAPPDPRQQPPPPGWPGPDPYADPRRRQPQEQKSPGWHPLLALLCGATAVGATVVFPTVFLCVVLIVLVLLRAIDHASSKLAVRRSARGPKGSDPFMVALGTPWGLVRGALLQLLMIPLAAIVGGVVFGVLVYAKPDVHTDTLAAWAAGAFTVMVVIGPGSGSPRRGLNRTIGVFARGGASTAVVTLVLAVVTLFAVAGAATQEPSWEPVNMTHKTPNALVHEGTSAARHGVTGYVRQVFKDVLRHTFGG